MAETRGSVRRALRDGLPLVTVAAVAIATLVAIVVVVNREPAPRATAFAELRISPTSCTIDFDHSYNAGVCEVLGGGRYRLHFLRALARTTPIVSRASCCAGRVSASVDADRHTVLIEIGGGPARVAQVSILLP